MPILIDPPVSAYSPPEEILAWIRELEKLREEHGADPAIDSALEQAAGWLDAATERGRGPIVVTVRDVRIPFASVFRLVAQFTFASMVIAAVLLVFWLFFLMISAPPTGGPYTPRERVSPTSPPAVEATPRAPPGLDPRR